MGKLKFVVTEKELIASPLNYIGGKYKLLDQIIPKFPKNIKTMIDLFSGGCNVGINTNCHNVIFIDKNIELIYLLNRFKDHSKSEIFETIFYIIDKYNLSKSFEYGYDYYGCNSAEGLAKYNREKFLKLRGDYNNLLRDSFYKDMMFYVLIIYSFNNQIRFNKSGEFNLPVGKRDFNTNIQNKLADFIDRIKNKNCFFIDMDFRGLNINRLSKETFIYADPPYLIGNAPYNEQNGWGIKDEYDLLNLLDELDAKGMKFALSNVLRHNNNDNIILNDWLSENRGRYYIHQLDYGYSNSNYQKQNKDKKSTMEILVTNYY